MSSAKVTLVKQSPGFALSTTRSACRSPQAGRIRSSECCSRRHLPLTAEIGIQRNP